MSPSSLIRLIALLGLAVCWAAIAHQGENHETNPDDSAPDPVVLAPGYRPLAYAAPEPGSYQLPSLGQAGDGEVLDVRGSQLRLAELLGDRVTLLAFMYASCDDVNGCPLTDLVFRQVQKSLSDQPQFADKLQILSLSFDPERDTPDALSKTQQTVTAISQPEWRYLTTSGVDQLSPILDQYQQSVIAEVDSAGNKTGYLSHILRVFLIDPTNTIRNIYSTSFLHADTVENDVKTLLLESGVETSVADGIVSTAAIQRAGDDKTGYESKDYTTNSLALLSRTGEEIDLLAHAGKPRSGLGAVPGFDELSTETVSLGRRLFFDRRLSLNDTISCAMCHVPEQGFASNELSTAIGVEGRTVRRNAPTILNTGYLKRFFHDGREFTLENQVWAPLFARNEMAIPSPGYLLGKLRAIEGYEDAFARAFGDKKISMERIGQALAQYQRTLIAADSPFDQWHFGGSNSALDESAKAGYALFVGKAGCVSCHQIDDNQAIFTDDQMHNTGIGYARSMYGKPQFSEVLIAPGVYVKVDRAAYAAASEPPPADLGLYEITQDPADRWKYKTPGLRNVSLTAPYMHDGSLKTLREVVLHYNEGGEPNEVLDPRIRPLGLSDLEINQLVAFLESLTSPEVATLVEDAFAAPIGDAGSSWQ